MHHRLSTTGTQGRTTIKRHLHHRLRGLALGLALATPIALAAQGRLDEGAGARLPRTPHAPAAAPTLQAQTGRTITVLSYNAAGAVRVERDDPDSDPFGFVDVLADRLVAELPQLVGLQEMCGSQLSLLESSLEDRGYPMVANFYPGKEVDFRCLDVANSHWPPQQVGKAVLAVGEAAYEPPEIPDLDVCLRWEAGPVPLRFCSVHTAPTDNRIPTMARTLNRWADFGVVIVVGDFNAEPDARVMDHMYIRRETPPWQQTWRA